MNKEWLVLIVEAQKKSDGFKIKDNKVCLSLYDLTEKRKCRF